MAAHGGICAYTFHPDGSVDVEPLELDPGVLRRLRDQLLLFYTGEARSASPCWLDQDERSKTGDRQMLENLHRTKEIGLRSRELLWTGDLEGYAELMHEHWENKRRRSPGMANEQHRPALHARAAQRGDRRQARRCRRRRFPARLRPQSGGHAAGDGGGGRLRAGVRLRVRRRVLPASTRERPAAAGRRSSVAGLIGRKRAAALRRAGSAGRRCSTARTSVSGAGSPSTARAPAPSLEELLEPHPTWSSSTVPTTSSRALRRGGARRGRARARREAGGWLSARRSSASRPPRAGACVKVGFNHRFHPGIARPPTRSTPVRTAS